jgi:hypothetical protein
MHLDAEGSDGKEWPTHKSAITEYREQSRGTAENIPGRKGWDSTHAMMRTVGAAR